MKLATVFATLPLALALPHANTAKRSQDVFTVTSARSASPVHLLPMNAANSSFFLGEKTSTYCPPAVSQVAPCPKGDVTQFVGDGSALDVSVPGGQAIYVDDNGALRFTTPHSGYMGPGASTGPFIYHPGTNTANGLGSYKYTGQGASGFMACPIPLDGSKQYVPGQPAKWQVFANLGNATVPTGKVRDCLGFDAMTSQARSNGTAAWEYI